MKNDDLLEIEIDSDLHDAAELHRELAHAPAAPEGVRYEMRPRPATAFRLEPVIIVALLTGGAQVLSAVIAGLLVLAKDRRRNVKVRVKTADGMELEVSGPGAPEEVERLLAAVEGRQVKRILLTADDAEEPAR